MLHYSVYWITIVKQDIKYGSKWTIQTFISVTPDEYLGSDMSPMNLSIVIHTASAA